MRGLINARVRDLDTEAAQAEDVRDDVAPGELPPLDTPPRYDGMSDRGR